MYIETRKCHECPGKIQIAQGVNMPCPCPCHVVVKLKYIFYCGNCDRGSVHFATMDAAQEYRQHHICVQAGNENSGIYQKVEISHVERS